MLIHTFRQRNERNFLYLMKALIKCVLFFQDSPFVYLYHFPCTLRGITWNKWRRKRRNEAMWSKRTTRTARNTTKAKPEEGHQIEEHTHLKNFNRKLPRNKYIYKYIYIPCKPKKKKIRKNDRTLIDLKYIDTYIEKYVIFTMKSRSMEAIPRIIIDVNKCCQFDYTAN